MYIIFYYCYQIINTSQSTATASPGLFCMDFNQKCRWLRVHMRRKRDDTVFLYVQPYYSGENMRNSWPSERSFNSEPLYPALFGFLRKSALKMHNFAPQYIVILTMNRTTKTLDLIWDTRQINNSRLEKSSSSFSFSPNLLMVYKVHLSDILI